MQTYGTPAQIQVTPTNHKNPDDEEPAVVTLTISANDPEALAALLDTLRRQPAVDVRPQASPRNCRSRAPRTFDR